MLQMSTSHLPQTLKIREKVKHNQVMNYLTDSNICYRCQSEFRKNQATYFSLSYLTDEISAEFDSVLFTVMILVDLHKTYLRPQIMKFF